MASDDSFSSEPSSSSSSSPPDSSPDPYASLSSQSRYQYDIVQPLPPKWFRTLLGNYDSKMDKLVQKHLSSITDVVQRPLTHDEASTIASYIHKNNQYASISLPLGLCGGVYRAVKTWKTYDFPFVGSIKSENGWFNGERVRWKGFDLAGRQAKMVVHGLRLSLYGLLGIFFSSVTIGSYWGVFVGSQEARDPKLEKLRQEVQHARAVRMGEIRTQWKRAETSPIVIWQKQKPATSRPTKSAREGEGEGAAYASDDASPTAEGFETEEFGTHGSEGAGRYVNTKYSPTKDQEPPVVQQRSTPSSSSSTPSPPRYSSSPFGQDPSNPTTATGNAWDRIRREASSSPSASTSTFPSTPRNRRAQQSGGEDDDGSSDGFSYSQEEEDKAYAKGEAQREFDEMVERERRGSGDEEGFTEEDADFNADGSGAGSGWKRERKRRAL